MRHGKESTKSDTLITSIDVLYSADTLVTAWTLSLNEIIFVLVFTKLAVYMWVSLGGNQEIAFLRSNQYNTFHVPYDKGMQQNRSVPWARKRLHMPLWTMATKYWT
jgi:hypothetical protein